LDVCIILNDPVKNRTASSILKESGFSCIIIDNPTLEILSSVFEKEKPEITLFGSSILKARVSPDDLTVFRFILTKYRERYKERFPVCILYHAEDKDVPRVQELSRISFIIKLPESAKTEDWKQVMISSLRRINDEFSLNLTVFAKEKTQDFKKTEEIRYSEKDFEVNYSMKDHILFLSGPLIGRASARIDMVLKNEKVHQDVKLNGDRDKNGKRILKVDWSGIVYVSEQAAHHCFLVFKQLMENGVYEVIRFEHFKEKEPLFSNKTHFELFVNRFCSQENE